MYSSIQNEKIKSIKKLREKKYRDIEGLFIVEGKNLVMEAYKNNLLKTLIVLDNSSFNLSIETIRVSENVMKYLSELNTPNEIMGICYKKKEENISGNILILDNIQDPGNLGTIIRSAVAFSISTIIVSPDTVSIYNSKVLRSTQGLLFDVNIIVRDISGAIDDLKQNGYKIYGTKVDNGKNLKDIDSTNKYAVIMGNEGSGVNKDILDKCDEYIYIPMNEKCESLNVGVATSIILYEMRY
ncbi:MAG: RNA methyltransferase [Bacillales bacterium]|nr:RNA methyltransferase [Bacillales bacterium]